MNVKLAYEIIFTIDISAGSMRNIAKIKPNALRFSGISVTEDEVEDRKIFKLHRKYCGRIDRDRLLRLLEEMEHAAYRELDVNRTMGSLTERGIIPAVSVDAMLDDGEMNVYISQIPMDEDGVWRRIRGHPQKDIVLGEFRDRMTEMFDGLYGQLDGHWDELPDSFDFDFDNMRFELKKEIAS